MFHTCSVCHTGTLCLDVTCVHICLYTYTLYCVQAKHGALLWCARGKYQRLWLASRPGIRQLRTQGMWMYDADCMSRSVSVTSLENVAYNQSVSVFRIIKLALHVLTPCLSGRGLFLSKYQDMRIEQTAQQCQNVTTAAALYSWLFDESDVNWWFLISFQQINPLSVFNKKLYSQMIPCIRSTQFVWCT